MGLRWREGGQLVAGGGGWVEQNAQEREGGWGGPKVRGDFYLECFVFTSWLIGAFDLTGEAEVIVTGS